MTAFARREARAEWGSLAWELRSLNSRYLETYPRLPEEFRVLESAVRERVTARLRRGKVECTLRVELDRGGAVSVDHELAGRVIAAAREVEDMLGHEGGLRAIDVLRWPGVAEAAPPDLDAIGPRMLAELDTALDELVSSRRREGGAIAAALGERCDAVEAITVAMRARLPEVIAAARERLETRLGELRDQLEPTRLEQEMVMLAQKLDVSEEMDRLASHVTEVRRALGLDEPVGRRLDFIMQEMNREANTLGSKSADGETTQASVDLKVLIEQMREQIQNVE